MYSQHIQKDNIKLNHHHQSIVYCNISFTLRNESILIRRRAKYKCTSAYLCVGAGGNLCVCVCVCVWVSIWLRWRKIVVYFSPMGSSVSKIQFSAMDFIIQWVGYICRKLNISLLLLLLLFIMLSINFVKPI